MDFHKVVIKFDKVTFIVGFQHIRRIFPARDNLEAQSPFFSGLTVSKWIDFAFSGNTSGGILWWVTIPTHCRCLLFIPDELTLWDWSVSELSFCSSGDRGSREYSGDSSGLALCQ